MISYAQNLEDVILNRLFDGRTDGFYIDVGAHDPIELSVTKHFYDLGWNGINIEPVPESHQKFVKIRTRDINLNCAIGSRHELLPLYKVKGHPELSSLNCNIAVSTGELFNTIIDSASVEVYTLREICDKFCTGEIDFIKIDVEGFEKQVILGADWGRYRPIILVVESMTPNSGRVEDWDTLEERSQWPEWEPLILAEDYIVVYFDGLNRYYLRKEDEDLKKRLSFPVTFFQDHFFHYKHRELIIEARLRAKALEDENKELERRVKQLAEKNERLGKQMQNLKNENRRDSIPNNYGMRSDD